MNVNWDYDKELEDAELNDEVVTVEFTPSPPKKDTSELENYIGILTNMNYKLRCCMNCKYHFNSEGYIYCNHPVDSNCKRNPKITIPTKEDKWEMLT